GEPDAAPFELEIRGGAEAVGQMGDGEAAYDVALLTDGHFGIVRSGMDQDLVPQYRISRQSDQRRRDGASPGVRRPGRARVRRCGQMAVMLIRAVRPASEEATMPRIRPVVASPLPETPPAECLIWRFA